MIEGWGNVAWASLVIFPQLGRLFREFVFRRAVHVVMTLLVTLGTTSHQHMKIPKS